MARPTAKLEKEYQEQGYQLIAGLDEAGKGAWAGPVVSAAVVLPDKTSLPHLNDSKLLSHKQREELFLLVKGQAIAWGVGVVDAYLVDEIGLAEAHRQSMRLAVKELGMKPNLLLVDGTGIKQLGIKAECIVKGDQKVRCIAAASILAKVTRDRLMVEYEKEHPGYGFANHKGYGTQEHQDAIAANGICGIHRLSYTPVHNFWQQNLFQLA